MKDHIAFAQFCSAGTGSLLFAICLAFCTLGLGVSASAQQLSITTFNVAAAGTGAYQGTISADINPEGEITGTYVDSNYVFHGFLRSPQGVFTKFDVPGADQTPGDFNGTFPSTIDQFGAITGTYIDVNDVYHGFVAVPCEQGCFESNNETAAASTSASTNAKVSPAPRGVGNPRLRLLSWYRSLQAQPSK